MLSNNDLAIRMELAAACIAGEINCMERDRDNCIDHAVTICDKVTKANTNDHSVLYISARCQQIFSHKLGIYLSVIEPLFQAFSINDNFVTMNHAHIDTERPICQAREATMQINQTHQPVTPKQIDAVAKGFLSQLNSTDAGKKILASYTHVAINQECLIEVNGDFDVAVNVLRNSTNLECNIGYFNGSLFTPLTFMHYLSARLSGCGYREGVLIKSLSNYHVAHESAVYDIAVPVDSNKRDLTANAISKVVCSAIFHNTQLHVNAQDEAMMMAFEQVILNKSATLDDVWLDGLDVF